MIYRYSFRVDGGSDWNRTVYSEFQGIEDISKIYIYIAMRIIRRKS